MQTTAGDVSYTITGAAAAWDTFSIPPECRRSLENIGDEDCFVLMLTAGDHRKHIHWSDETQDAAKSAGLGFDASGFVAPQAMINLAQK